MFQWEVIDMESSKMWMLSLSETIAKVLLDEKTEDKIKQLRLSAIKALSQCLQLYRSRGHRIDLINAIAEKKCKMILQTTFKAEMDRIMNPDSPKYNGNEFIDNPHFLLEEELICWCEMESYAPLSDAAFKRYMKV